MPKRNVCLEIVQCKNDVNVNDVNGFGNDENPHGLPDLDVGMIKDTMKK